MIQFTLPPGYEGPVSMSAMLRYEQRAGLFGPHTAVRAPAARKSSVKSQSSQYRHIWIVTGPAGCGKTTIAEHLAKELSLPYLEGDEYHPKSNVDKMAQGTPLNDEDRWDWLIVLRQQAMLALNRGVDGVVLTCSALKRKYRDVIRIAHYQDADVMVHFIYLRADEDTLRARVKARKGHYMKDGMVHSQFNSLEEPTDGETDATAVDVTGSVEDVKKKALYVVLKTLERNEGKAPL